MSNYSLPKRRRIFLMRHGDVSYFDSARRPVDPDTVSLNERGRAQASAAGHVFAQQGIHFDRVITSGLPRTLETAQKVLAETRQRINIDIEPAWRELRGGPLGQLPPEQHASAFLRVFDGIVTENTRFLGGETIGELLDRVLPPLATLCADFSWDTALLVLHGGVNRALLSYAVAPGQRLFIGHFEQAAGCINALDIGTTAHDWIIHLLNYSPPEPLHRHVRHTTMEQIYLDYLRHSIS